MHPRSPVTHYHISPLWTRLGSQKCQVCQVGSNANARLPERGRPGGHLALECAQPDKKANSWQPCEIRQVSNFITEPSRQSPMWSSLLRTGWHWRPQSGMQEKPRTDWHCCSQSAAQEKPAKCPGSFLLPQQYSWRLLCWLSFSTPQSNRQSHIPVSKPTLRSRLAHTCSQGKSFQGKS